MLTITKHAVRLLLHAICLCFSGHTLLHSIEAGGLHILHVFCMHHLSRSAIVSTVAVHCNPTVTLTVTMCDHRDRAPLA